ncbi:MAG: acyl-CoA dehydrogenase family protein [Lapillicoccus sp.]
MSPPRAAVPAMADLDSGTIDNEFPNGDDLALSLGTDFYGLDELLTDRERDLRDRVRVWCDREVAPAAAGYWERAEFPVELAQGYGRLGIAGASIVGDGCPGVSFLAEGMIAAELARGDGSIATLNAVHSGLAMTTIAMLGSPEQRARYLPRMATCEALGAFALTEPNHGSDVVALETTARRDGDEWVLDGQKRWIGNGTVADIVVVWARDDDGQVGAFIVEHPDGAEHPVSGYHARKIVGKAANRAVWQAQIRLSGVRVPADARLAQARTWNDANYVLAKSRQTVAWEAVGHAVAAYEGALTYSLRREQFGRPLARFQLIQDKLAHMLSDITGMQLMCTRMSQLQAEGRVSIEHAALAKLNTGDAARRVCAMARDILGGNGILLDHHVARHHADIEAVYTYEGTDTIQSLIVGRAITGLNAFR